MVKVIKEKHHAFLRRTYKVHGKFFAEISILQLFSFKDANKKYTEKELWVLNSHVLDFSSGILFDYGIPKKKAEFLAAGYAFSAEENTTKSYVRISFAGKEKTLAVYGNRTWNEMTIGAKMSEPEPFRKLPLTNAQAFGGKRDSYNPDGKGIDMIPEKKGEKDLHTSFPKIVIDAPSFPKKEQPKSDVSQPKPLTYPLPNTESPTDLILNREDRPRPATFHPMQTNNPQRVKLFGTFDEKWLKKNWPHFADDMNWEYFNNAWPDQRYDNFFVGNESFSIENMHPTNPHIEASLPGWRLRAFCEQALDAEQSKYGEVPLELDTVWFVPETEQGVLVWHGQIQVEDEKAADLLYIQLADELLVEAPLSLEHYHELLLQKKSKLSLDERLKGAKKDKKVDLDAALKNLEKNSSKVARKIKKNLASFKANIAKGDKEIDKILKKSDSKLGKLLHDSKEALKEKDTSKLDSAAAMLSPAGMTAAVASAKAAKPISDMAGFFKSHDLDVLKDMKAVAKNPAAAKDKLLKYVISKTKSLNKDGDKLKDAMEKMKKLSKSPNIIAAKLRAQAEKIQDPEAKAKLIMAADAYSINKAHSTISNEKMTRYDLEQAVKQGQSLKGEDLSELDLNGINLEGIDLSQVNFTSTNLSHANLSHANLSGANLHGSDLSSVKAVATNFFTALTIGTIFNHANCQQANFTACKLQYNEANHADFSEANFASCQFIEGEWEKYKFPKSKMEKVVFVEIEFTQCDFHAADLESASFSSCKLHGTIFSKIKAKKIRFTQSELHDINWQKCDLSSASFVKTSLRNNHFTNTSGKKLSLISCQLSEITFNTCDLPKISFGQCKANAISFTDCDLRNSRIGKESLFEKLSCENCNLTQACWISAKLPESSYYRCKMQGCCFSQSQLTKSQFRYCEMQDSRFQEAYLEQATFRWSNLQSTMLRQAHLVNASLVHCNLYGVDFYHAVTKQTVMRHSLLTDPLPENFEEKFIHG